MNHAEKERRKRQNQSNRPTGSGNIFGTPYNSVVHSSDSDGHSSVSSSQDSSSSSSSNSSSGSSSGCD